MIQKRITLTFSNQMYCLGINTLPENITFKMFDLIQKRNKLYFFLVDFLTHLHYSSFDKNSNNETFIGKTYKKIKVKSSKTGLFSMLFL